MSSGEPTDETEVIRKVAVLRALKLGDMLVAVPAFRALRAALPRAEVVLVGLPWAREFAGRFAHLIDGFREFPGWPGMPEREPRLDELPQFLGRMREEGFDIVVQMHGTGTVVNDLCARFGAKRVAGFYPSGSECPDPTGFLPWPERGLELRRLLALTEFLGCPSRGEDLEFPLRAAEIDTAARLTGTAPFAVVHPGASVPERRWPVERFAAVADGLGRRGLRVVLTGTAAERELTQALAAATAVPTLDLAGETDLGTTAAVIARAKLLVCNDTGAGLTHDKVGLVVSLRLL